MVAQREKLQVEMKNPEGGKWLKWGNEKDLSALTPERVEELVVQLENLRVHVEALGRQARNTRNRRTKELSPSG